jgi:transcription regulator MmyB-like protein
MPLRTGPVPTLRTPGSAHTPRPELRRLADAMYGPPALVGGHRTDVPAWHRPGSEPFGGLAEGRRDRDNARYLFVDPASRERFPDRDRRAEETVAVLAAGRHAGDERLRGLAGSCRCAARSSARCGRPPSCW